MTAEPQGDGLFLCVCVPVLVAWRLVAGCTGAPSNPQLSFAWQQENVCFCFQRGDKKKKKKKKSGLSGGEIPQPECSFLCNEVMSDTIYATHEFQSKQLLLVFFPSCAVQCGADPL